MPLSEHEQRLLEQMERALYAEDPKFASALRGADPRRHYRRRIAKASIGFVAGIALLMTGVVVPMPVISVVGFILMLASAFFALSSWRQIPGPGSLSTPSRGKTSRGSASRRSGGKSGLMGRLEERWNRRREEGPR